MTPNRLGIASPTPTRPHARSKSAPHRAAPVAGLLLWAMRKPGQLCEIFGTGLWPARMGTSLGTTFALPPRILSSQNAAETGLPAPRASGFSGPHLHATTSYAKQKQTFCPALLPMRGWRPTAGIQSDGIPRMASWQARRSGDVAGGGGSASASREEELAVGGKSLPSQQLRPTHHCLGVWSAF